MEKMDNNQKMQKMSYKKFLLMTIISFMLMYGIMFLNVAENKHIYLSITRMYMALLMVTSMAIVMLLMMAKMYPDKKLNKGIILGSIILFVVSLAGLRTQTPVGDVQYMKAMIPHHSSAIMTSKNANIKDPELKRLSEQIIASQEEEITQMKTIITRLKDEK